MALKVGQSYIDSDPFAGKYKDIDNLEDDKFFRIGDPPIDKKNPKDYASIPAPVNTQNEKDDYFDSSKFEQLLNRLEGSKGRQQRQKSVEGRRDTFAQGLANMMNNF